MFVLIQRHKRHFKSLVVTFVFGVILTSCSGTKPLLTESECTKLFGRLYAELEMAKVQGIDYELTEEEVKLTDFCGKTYNGK